MQSLSINLILILCINPRFREYVKLGGDFTMVNTVVCKEEGCTGNRFKISVQRLKIILICIECGGFEKYNKGINLNVPTICRGCNGEIFKVSKDVKKSEMYFECVDCGKKFTFILMG